VGLQVQEEGCQYNHSLPLASLAELKRQAVVPWTGIDLWLSIVGCSM
jgi:hypothetical protein